MAQMTPEQVSNIRDELMARFEEASAEMGYRITLGRGKYNEVLIFEIEVAPIKLDGTVVSKETDIFNRKCYQWRIRKEALGREVTIQSHKYKIIGAKHNAKKYPLLLESVSNGKRFKFSPRVVWEALPIHLKLSH